MNVYLHLGAHRTGTSFIQSALEECQLENTYISLRHGRIINCIKQNDQVAFRKEWDHIEDERFLLSDENLLGIVNTVKGPEIYMDAVGRIERIAEYFARFNPTVIFSVRDYVSFAESVYSKRSIGSLKAKNVLMSWEAFVNKTGLDPSRTTWVPIITTLCKIFATSQIVVPVYKRSPSEADHLDRFAQIVGVPAIPMPKKRHANESLSRAVLSELKEQGLPSDDNAQKKMIREVRLSHTAKGDCEYVSQETYDRAFQAFQRDLDAIERIERVELVR